MKALLFFKSAVVFNVFLLSGILCGSAVAQEAGNVLTSAVPESAAADIAGAEQSNTAQVRIVLSISDRKALLFRGDALLDSYPVAVGAAETPTPIGQFTVSQMVVEPIWQSPWTGEFHAPGANSALGLRWIGFTTTSAGSFGFHGTPTLNSIGKAVSNGCVRMRNEDVVALFEQVDVGTPVTVVP